MKERKKESVQKERKKWKKTHRITERKGRRKKGGKVLKDRNEERKT